MFYGHSSKDSSKRKKKNRLKKGLALVLSVLMLQSVVSDNLITVTAETESQVVILDSYDDTASAATDNQTTSNTTEKNKTTPESNTEEDSTTTPESSTEEDSATTPESSTEEDNATTPESSTEEDSATTPESSAMPETETETVTETETETETQEIFDEIVEQLFEDLYDEAEEAVCDAIDALEMPEKEQMIQTMKETLTEYLEKKKAVYTDLEDEAVYAAVYERLETALTQMIETVTNYDIMMLDMDAYSYVNLDAAGKDDITTTVSVQSYTDNGASRTDNNIQMNLGFRYEFPDNKKLDKTYDLTFPKGLISTAASGSNEFSCINSQTSEATKIGKIMWTEGKVSVELYEDDSSGNLIVNRTDGTGKRIFRSVFCEITRLPCKYLTNNEKEGKETLTFTYGDTGDTWTTADVEYTPRKIPMKITHELSDKKDANGYYTCTTTIIPGNDKNQRVDGVTIGEQLTDLVYVSGTEQLKVEHKGGTSETSNITCEYTGKTGDSPLENTLTYTIPDFSDFNKYGEEDKIIFTYKVKENTAIYQQTGEKKLASKAGVFKNADAAKTMSSGGDCLAGNTDKEAKSVTVTPKPLIYGYEIKTDASGKRYLQWTVTVNSNEIDMYEPEFTVTIGGAKNEQKKYLDLKQDSMKQTQSNEFTFTYTEESDNTVLAIGTIGSGKVNKLSKKNTITFDTYITDTFYKEVQNNNGYVFDVKVALTWKYGVNGPEGKIDGGTWDGKLSQPIFNDAVTKKSGGFDAAEGIVWWTVTLNEQKVKKLTNVQLTDILPEGLTDIKVYEGDKNSTAEALSPEVTINQDARTVTFEFAEVNDKKTYTIKAKVPDAVKYGNNNNNGTITAYNNSIQTTADEFGVVERTTKSDPVKYSSELLDKTGEYDKANLRIKWTVTINKSQTKLTNVVMTDTIPEGLTYDEDTSPEVTVTNKTNNSKVTPTSSNCEKNKISLTFDEIAEGNTYEVVYYTKIADVTLLDKNNSSSLQVSNTVVLNSDETRSAGLENKIQKTKSVNIPVTVIKKEKIEANQSFTKWRITVNDDYQNLVGDGGASAKAVITDTYSVSPETVKLTILPSDLTLTAVFKDGTKSEVSVEPSGTTGQNAVVKVDSVNNKFEVSLPIQKSEDYQTAQYILEYTIWTDEIPDGVSSFSVSNQAEFECGRGRGVPVQKSGSVGSGTINVVGGGGGGITDDSRRKLVVTKTDNTGNKIAGVTFELHSKYGLEQTQITDASGQAVFEKIPKKDLRYYIVETKTAEGYVLDDTPYYIDSDASNITKKEVTQSIKNEKAAADIQFTKKGKLLTGSTKLLPGAEFTLYDGDKGIKTAKSDEKGIVKFENVPFGTYTIKETAAPEGYAKSETEITVTMKQKNLTTTSGSKEVMVTLKGNGADFKDGILTDELKKMDVVIKLDAGTDVDITKTMAPDTVFMLVDNTTKKTVSTAKAGDAELRFKEVPYGTYDLVVQGSITGYAIVYQDVRAGRALEKQEHRDSTLGTVNNVTDTTLLKIPVEAASYEFTATVVDKASPEKKLPGAAVELYRIGSNDNKTLYQMGKTNSNGEVTWYLPEGIYEVRQTQSPSGYQKDTETFEFELNAANLKNEHIFYNPIAPVNSSGGSSGSSNSGSSSTPVTTPTEQTNQATAPRIPTIEQIVLEQWLETNPPALAVENTTVAHEGGSVGVIGSGLMNHNADGLIDVDGREAYTHDLLSVSGVQAKAKSGYWIDMSAIVVRVLPSEGIEAAEAPVVFADDNHFTATLYVTINGVPQTIEVYGTAEMVKDDKGNVVDLILNLDDLPVPLSFGIPFATVDGLVKTGDDAPIEAVTAVMLLCLAGGAWLLLRKRRKAN